MKGYIPIFFFDNIEISINFLIIFIFFGHLFPIWLKFKGGKGIAVLIGCLLAYNILYGLIFVIIWLIVAIISKYSSLSALCASSAVLTIMYYEKESLTFIMFIIVIMIFFKHLSNIKRLLSGKESKIVLKK
jgi:glycerol-3-phosphate acyltransferase PlsY